MNNKHNMFEIQVSTPLVCYYFAGIALEGNNDYNENMNENSEYIEMKRVPSTYCANEYMEMKNFM